MALINCAECGKEISKKAAACPHCGAKPKRTGLFTKIIAIFVGMVLLGSLVGQLQSSKDRSQAKSSAAKTLPVPRDSTATPKRGKTMADIQTVAQALKAMRTSEVAGAGWASAQLIIETFNKGAELLSDSGMIGALTGDERGKVMELRQLLEKRQAEIFPELRRLGAKEMDDKLWESDVDVAAVGDRSAVISFVGGMFAANKNIGQAQSSFRPLMMRLRFKQSRYRWYKDQDEYTYYDLKAPKDSEIAQIDADGRVKQVNLTHLDEPSNTRP